MIVYEQLQYCILNEDNTITLKKDHNYYYQIIGQLRISERNKCFFVIYTNNWINIEEIDYDEEFWQNKMVDKLKM